MLDDILLYCNNLYKSYKDGLNCVQVLYDVNFYLKYNEMVSIIGKSGSGKTTLLHLLGGLDKPTAGKIFFQGKLLNKMSSLLLSNIRNRYLGFIYQFHYLLSDFNILENVAIPLMISGMSLRKSCNIAKNMLENIGLANHMYYFPSELSGGEKQRVAIARALINNPLLVFADEPTGNLDQINTNNILKLLKKINMCYGTSFIIVTHDMQLSYHMDRQLEICNGRLCENNINTK